MTGQQDANIKLLYAADNGTFFATDTVPNSAPFDVVANVEIGKTLMNVVSKEELFVAVVNLSQSTVLARETYKNDIAPQDNPEPRNAELRVQVTGGWNAAEGDVLEAIASYKVTAGTIIDFSTSRSHMFVVTA